MGNGTGVGKDWRGRLAARYARAAAVTLLSAAAVGQAIAQAVLLGGGRASGGSAGFSATLATEYALPLSLLALLATVPLGVYRPAMAAAAVTLGNAVALASFGQVTVAGIIAELVAACWLGLEGGLDRTGVFQRPGGNGRGGPGAMAGRYLATGLGLPFLGIALGWGGWVAVLLAAAVPVAAGAGIAAWAGRLARTRTEAGEALADTLLAHTARGERARIARELHDVVAHHISMIAVLAETGRLATPGLPEAGARRFLEIGDTARAGLTEMRRLLGVLREDAPGAGTAAGSAATGPGGEGTGPGGAATGPGGAATGDGRAAGPGRATALAADAGDGLPATRGGARASRQPQPGLAQLTELIEAAREASMAGTRLIISGPVAPLDPGVELAAYRIVQEALTNARRHAAGAAVDVELRYSPGSLRVRVRDNGPGPVTAPDPTGLRAAGNPAGCYPAAGRTAGGGHPGDARRGAGPLPEPAPSQPGGAGQAHGGPGGGHGGPGGGHGGPGGGHGGPGGGHGGPGGGHGLLGMRERAFSVGGALYVGAAPGGGFLVEAVLPSDPDPVRTSRVGTVGTGSAATGTGGGR